MRVLPPKLTVLQELTPHLPQWQEALAEPNSFIWHRKMKLARPMATELSLALNFSGSFWESRADHEGLKSHESFLKRFPSKPKRPRPVS